MKPKKSHKFAVADRHGKIVDTFTSVWMAKSHLHERNTGDDSLMVWENDRWMLVDDAELYRTARKVMLA